VVKQGREDVRLSFEYRLDKVRPTLQRRRFPRGQRAAVLCQQRHQALHGVPEVAADLGKRAGDPLDGDRDAGDSLSYSTQEHTISARIQQ
jgi:hypothetical protein